MALRAHLLSIVAAGLICATARGQVIHTIAGNGTAGNNGDGDIAVAAQLNNPWGLATDDTGNLYVADRNNNRIRKISIGGTISTVAGTGSAGFEGDGGAATDAQFNSPCGIASDAGGNLYISDKNNHRIRKVSSGAIVTLAGNGTAGYSGDGGPANAAQLNNPRGIAVDALGNVYIADAGNHAVRKIDNNGTITTVAGNGTAGFSGDGGAAASALLYGPYHVATDVAGNLYIADVDNSRIRRVTPAGIISTVAGNGIAGYSGDGGPATAASLREPISVAVDKAGNLFIADAWNAGIRKVNLDGTIETIAGNGTPGYSGDEIVATTAQLNNPYGIALSGSVLFIADNGNNRIRLTDTKSLNPALSAQSSIQVFPNPSRGEFTVQLNAPGSTAIRLELIGIDGTRYYTFTCLPNWPFTVHPGIPRGFYFIVGSDRSVSPTAVVIQ